jgi:ribonuclease VapC
VIIDSSVLVAILRDEPEAWEFAQRIAQTGCRISAANYLEAAIVIDCARDPIVSRKFDELIRESSIVVEPVTEQHAHIAREAYRDFGKGCGHPAQLNFADCFAYALAKSAGEPLLFKGNDFSRTDLVPAR